MPGMPDPPRRPDRAASAGRGVALLTPAPLGPAAAFGLAELGRALAAAGYRPIETGEAGGAPLRVHLATVAAGLPPELGPGRPPERPEAYLISRPAPDALALVGRDDVGLMYACLDLAEQVALGGDLETAAARGAAPELAVRGLYTFVHSAAASRGWLDAPGYWRRYADELARCRYNRFNLIFGHQTAHLIPIYAFTLDDLDADFPDIRVDAVTAAERARNLGAIQAASSAMASRGIRFTLGIWQSRPWTIANGLWETQPTRVSGTDDLARLAAYTRAGLARLLDRCPDVGGLQLRLNVESGVADQRFFVEAFAPVLRELAVRGRRLAVELRAWGLHPETLAAFRETGQEVIVSAKYFAEHQALPYQPPAMRGSYSYDSYLAAGRPDPFLWQLWSLGSHRLFAWGDPDYARRFARSCHLGAGVGFEVTPPGSQRGFSEWGELPAEEPARTDLPAQPDFERHWFFHLAFGRMGYDPTTPDAVFLHQLARRTTPAAAPTLLGAYRAASQVVSYLIAQRMDDPNMYVWPELDCGGPIDHHSVAPPGDATLFATAREHAAAVVGGATGAKRSPFDAAGDLVGFADAIDSHLSALAQLPDLADNLEYRTVRTDFAALAALARFHASKANATGNLALFYATGERRFIDAAVVHAMEEVRHWEMLGERTADYSARLHLGPSGGHWRDNLPRVRYDLERVRQVHRFFTRYGLLGHAFDFGPLPPAGQSPRLASGLEPEPGFVGVDAATRYTPERGYGWLQPAGLRAVGFQVPRELLWGVHYVKPGEEYDPDVVKALPLEGLTQRYITGEGPRVFRVDLPDGEYEVSVLGPLVGVWDTPVHIAGQALTLGGSAAVSDYVGVSVAGGALEVTIGGQGPWALAALVVRPRAPEIAHLPPVAALAGEDLTLTATASAPEGVRSMTLRFQPAGGEAAEIPMASRDGASHRARVPAEALADAAAVEYELAAESAGGQKSSRGGFRVPVVRGYRPPRVLGAAGPATWRRGEPLAFRLALADGEHAREVRLHYREADQNREFRVASLPGGRSGDYLFAVDSALLDGAYPLIYYFEVVDALGGGVFHPDPLAEARYFVVAPEWPGDRAASGDIG